MTEVHQERELIDRARNGSVDAFEGLMRLHQDRLYRFLVVRGMSPSDAEDVVQEAFLSAFRYLGSYKTRWRFSTWLYTIARRIASRLPQPADPEVIPEMPDEPERHVAELQQRGALWGMARTVLSGEQFSALWLFYGEDFDVAEISRVLDRSRSWVKVNLHRARNRLAEALEDDDWGRSMSDEPIRT
ncbi:MAG: sigma-70 family RNA polymerase sigma factor [Xanthomonadales bacterium]|nr:sigma-70 family RNA polymerase sigma factor [Xanthomonadales bacterium]